MRKIFLLSLLFTLVINPVFGSDIDDDKSGGRLFTTLTPELHWKILEEYLLPDEFTIRGNDQKFFEIHTTYFLINREISERLSEYLEKDLKYPYVRNVQSLKRVQEQVYGIFLTSLQKPSDIKYLFYTKEEGRIYLKASKILSIRHVGKKCIGPFIRSLNEAEKSNVRISVDMSHVSYEEYRGDINKLRKKYNLELWSSEAYFQENFWNTFIKINTYLANDIDLSINGKKRESIFKALRYFVTLRMKDYYYNNNNDDYLLDLCKSLEAIDFRRRVNIAKSVESLITQDMKLNVILYLMSTIDTMKRDNMKNIKGLISTAKRLMSTDKTGKRFTEAWILSKIPEKCHHTIQILSDLIPEFADKEEITKISWIIKVVDNFTPRQKRFIFKEIASVRTKNRIKKVYKMVEGYNIKSKAMKPLIKIIRLNMKKMHINEVRKLLMKFSKENIQQVVKSMLPKIKGQLHIFKTSKKDKEWLFKKVQLIIKNDLLRFHPQRNTSINYSIFTRSHWRH